METIEKMETKENNASNSRLDQLIEEKSRLDVDAFPGLVEILDKEIEQIQSGQEFNKFIEIHDPNPTRVSFRVRLPIKEFPQANFVGRIVGQGGSTIKTLQEQTGCRIAVFGKGSIKDKNKEEELRLQGGKFAHLSHELHINIEAHGPPVSCYQRLAHAMSLIAPLLSQEYVDGSGPNQNGSGFGVSPRGRGMPPPGLMRRPMRGGPLMGSRPGLSRGAPHLGGRGGVRGPVPLAFAARGAPLRGGRGGPPPRGAPASRFGPAASRGRAGSARGVRGTRGGAPGGRGGASAGWATSEAESASAFQTDSYGYESTAASFENDNYAPSSYSAAAESDAYATYEYGQGEDGQQYDNYGASSWSSESADQSGSFGKTSASRLLGSYRSRPY